MSWLLPAFIPALLMLATFGLERVESGLAGDSISAGEVADVLAQAVLTHPVTTQARRQNGHHGGGRGQFLHNLGNPVNGFGLDFDGPRFAHVRVRAAPTES